MTSPHFFRTRKLRTPRTYGILTIDDFFSFMLISDVIGLLDRGKNAIQEERGGRLFKAT